MFDFHTHILNNIDDGADSIECSIKIVNRLSSQGVTDILLTPHYYYDEMSVDSFITKRQAKFDKLQAVNEAEVNLYQGAEVYFDESIKRYDEYLKLTINGTKYILLEMPKFTKWTNKLFDKLDNFISYTGLTPIIAHVERYSEIMKNATIINNFLDLGCLLQVNTESFLLKKTKKLANLLIEKNLVSAIGTDVHNLTSRPPHYSKAIEVIDKQFGKETTQAIQNGMLDIVSGKKVKTNSNERLHKVLGILLK